jgi:hypothetical protein
MGKDKKNKGQTIADVLATAKKRPLGKYLLGTGGIIETKLFQEFVFAEFSRNKSWSSIENFAKANGIYTPDDLLRLIKDHSPIKSIGEQNMELTRIIYTEKLKDNKKSFHSICVEKMDELCVLVGQDPYKVFKGQSWYQLQKNKNKNLKKTDFPKDYVNMIKIFDLRFKRVMDKQKLFLTWYAQNKNNKDFMQFLYKTLKYLKSQNKKLK